MTITLPQLSRRFTKPDHFAAPSADRYTLLPLRFTELDADRFVVSNLVGEFIVLPKLKVRQFLRHQVDVHSDVYNELKARHFLMDSESDVCLELLATKYRTKQSLLSQFTSLFMFVTTLRCDHSCPYCQVSRKSEDKAAFDMTPAMAERAVEFMFRTPSKRIKVEFQGGEPLLNFERIRQIVDLVEQRNAVAGRDVAFVIATNLSTLSDEHLDYCREHKITLSTSLDGPSALHNSNRPRRGNNSYERTIAGIARARATLGHDAVSALMTTTERSLEFPREIVDEYVAQGFKSIFLRSISPYGFAVRTGWADRYRVSDWMSFYKSALEHIIELNRSGIEIREEYATILLTKMLTPWPTGYVDLQSPAGIGISALVFNYDGDVYASDESRMLAEMGDKTFRLGNLHHDSYETVMRSPVLHSALSATMTEGMPMCSDCAFLPYCGSDPVFHHATQGDVVGHKPTSGFCQKQMATLRHLVTLLEANDAAATVLRSWVN